MVQDVSNRRVCRVVRKCPRQDVFQSFPLPRRMTLSGLYGRFWSGRRDLNSDLLHPNFRRAVSEAFKVDKETVKETVKDLPARPRRSPGTADGPLPWQPRAGRGRWQPKHSSSSGRPGQASRHQTGIAQCRQTESAGSVSASQC